MPEILKRLLGLKFIIRYRDDDAHNRPHLHVKYGEHEASIAIDKIEVLAGHLPPKQRKTAEEYITKHQKKLLKEWDKAVVGEQVERVN